MTRADHSKRIGSPARCERAQSNVVGVALLVGLTVVALGGLTAGIGTMVQSSAAAADADRVADGLAGAIDPSETVGTAEGEVRFGEGELRAEPRTVRVLDGSDGPDVGSGSVTVDVIERVETDVLVYENGDREVVSYGGAVLRSAGSGARMYRAPSIVADREGDVLAIGAPAVDAGGASYSPGRSTRLAVRTRVNHTRIDLGTGVYQVAVETRHPDAWARHFEAQNATVVTTNARFEGDRADSVVAHFHGERRGYLIVHETDLEVTHG